MTDTYDICRAKGSVSARWVSGGSSFGRFEADNMMSYASASVLAAAYGGDDTKIPKYVGFLYGSGDPAGLPDITRDMSWQSVMDMAAAVNGNVQVVNFNRKPTMYTINPPEGSNDLDDGPNPGPYKDNVVEFHAVTRTGLDGQYGNDTSGSSDFAGPLASGMTIFRAILLGDGVPCDDDNRYTVLAMVSMAKNGVYRQKPDNYELAVDWRVTFR